MYLLDCIFGEFFYTSHGVFHTSILFLTKSNKSMIYIKLFLRCILIEGIPLNYNIWGYLRPLRNINVDEPTIKSLYTSTIISSAPKYQDQASTIKGSFWYKTLCRWVFSKLKRSSLLLKVLWVWTIWIYCIYFCWIIPRTLWLCSIYIVSYRTHK